MSNLSELLPTGGGQNAVDFVASGTLSSGQAVALKTDGTVEAISGQSESIGTPVVFDTTDSDQMSATFDSNSNKVVIAYRDDTNLDYGKAVVGTVSGTSISFGTPVIFNSALSVYNSVVFDSSSNKVVIAYYDGGNSNYGTAIVGIVSGTSISFGSSSVFESATAAYISSTFDSNANKVVISYADSGNSNYGTAVVGTVSGTSISFGTPVVFESADSRNPSTAFDSNLNKIVIAYRDYGNSRHGTAVVGTVSGTSISFGTPVVFEAAQISYPSSTFDSNANKVVIAYRDDGNSNYGTAIVGTVSGTSITFGTPVVFESANSLFISAVFDSSANRVLVFYSDSGNSFYATFVTGSVSGNDITFTDPTVYANAYASDTSSVFDSNSNKVVVAYKDNTNSDYGTSVVFQTGFANVTDFIGITASAIADTATGAVNVYGGINEAQTGLTIGSDYYVQDDGSLSTTASDVKVGKAISATTINMMDLT